MIPTKKHQLEVTSTLEGQEIAMTIDENSVAHIMSVLTDLYSDAELAIVREYASNAWDSHVAAGNTNPIEVYTPKSLSPYLRIVDHGVGLDESDIQNIYSKYGLSTKTETNDQTGSLGLGCKSALAYSTQFTVIGTKDGTRTSVSVSRDEEGVGMMTVLDASETEDPNGVEILIPIKNYNDIASKARSLFRFWPQGTVLLDGAEPERVEGLEVNPHIKLIRGSEDDESYLVMGNVPYPIDQDKVDFGLPDGYSIVATVPMGSIHFTPSRERLMYTARTLGVLTQLADTFQTDLAASITREIEAAPDMPTALEVAVKWRSALPRALQNQTFTYRGHDVPDVIKPEQSGSVFFISSGEKEHDWYGKPYRVGAHSRVQQIDLVAIPHTIWVSGFERTFTPNVKKKLWQYCDENKIDYPKHFVTSSKAPKSPWIEASRIIPWEEVDKMVIPRYSKHGGNLISKSGRIPGSYNMYVVNGGVSDWQEGVPGDDIDTSVPLFYYVGDAGRVISNRIQLLIELGYEDLTVVCLTVNRVRKFRRLFPDTLDYMRVREEAAQTWWDSLSGEERQMLTYHDARYYNHISVAAGLPQTGIDDPVLTRAIRLERKMHGPRFKSLCDTMDKLRPMPHSHNHTDHSRANLFADYPLYEDHHRPSRVIRDHLIIYINAVYNSKES